MKIVILDDYQDVVRDLQCFDVLAKHEVVVLNHTYAEDALARRLHDADAIVLIRERTVITESLLKKLPNLKLISQTGKVSNHIDVALCQRYGVKVLEGVGSPVAPSELTWALIMSASRHIPTYSNNMRADQWQDSGQLGLGRTLRGLTIGIWGYGKIGQQIAKYAKAFDMHVLVWGSENSRQKALEDGLRAADSKQNFFSHSDVISLHLRLNDATRACVKAEDLALMKEDVLFVNTSRAELIEPYALFEALHHHPHRQAAVDVFDVEPALLENEPLLTLDNVTATPHIGYVEKNSYELYFSVAFENIVKWASE